MKLFQRPVLRAGAKTISKERRDAVKTLLQSFESFLENSEWLAGEEKTLADVTILANVASIKVGLFFLRKEKLILKVFEFRHGMSTLQIIRS